ncbi:HpcH/HpaI aldolase/citrate lyase family protein [Cupriavidus sp. 30B13]|uniref:HpcH/HpaI aldolase/citrate lyase family protein n=1 Tax=Cupriavidus sp. 30B13 TaxID=3384241 RepID=UPI003B9086FA
MPAQHSFLFVPATQPQRFPKAAASGAHAVIVDLEDAVAPPDKERARAVFAAEAAALRALCDSAGCELLVRINAHGSAWHAQDVQACAGLPVHGVVVPKPDDLVVLAALARAVGTARALYLLVESAAGFLHLADIARTPGVRRLMLGAADLMLDIGLPDDDAPLHHFRSQLALHSRLAGLPPPVDGVCLALDDPGRLEQEIGRAKRFGFGAKLCVHPTQIDAVNRGFLPPAAECEWARRVVEAAAGAGGAAVKVDGRLVDAPIIEQARRVLAAAG